MSGEELMAEIHFEQARVAAEQQSQPRHAAPKVDTPAPTPTPPADPELADIDAMERDNYIDARMARTMRAMHKRAQEAEKKSAEKIAEMEKKDKDRTDRTFLEHVEDTFAGLADGGYEHLFGRGTLPEVAKEHQERRNRIFAAAQITQDDSGRAIRDKLTAAVRSLCGAPKKAEADPEQTPAPTYGDTPAPTPKPKPKVSKTVDEWADGSIAKPSNRNGAPEPKGVQAAKQKVAGYMRERGLDPGHVGTSDENDDLPGND
jgi:hypothetical protein